jgi:hypothetical protein
MELSGNKMLPEQEPPKNGLHLWTLKRTTNAVSNGVSIREYSCPLRFRYNCRVGLRVVQGDNFIPLERRGLHHINSHVAHTIDDNDEAQDLIDDSDDNDDFDDNEDSEDEDYSDDEGESENYSKNSSDGVQSNCLLYQKLSKQLSHCV